MTCPDGFCRDAEHCMQGGRCEDAVGELVPLTMGAAGLFKPGERDRINMFIANELLTWADRYDQRAGAYQPVNATAAGLAARYALELRARAEDLCPSEPDDRAKVEARLAELTGEE